MKEMMKLVVYFLLTLGIRPMKAIEELCYVLRDLNGHLVLDFVRFQSTSFYFSDERYH